MKKRAPGFFINVFVVCGGAILMFGTLLFDGRL